MRVLELLLLISYDKRLTLSYASLLATQGPFANIAHGNSSIIADQLALKLVLVPLNLYATSRYYRDLNYCRLLLRWALTGLCVPRLALAPISAWRSMWRFLVAAWD